MTEEVTTKPVESEPIPEPVVIPPLAPEPVAEPIPEATQIEPNPQSTPEATSDTSTAQRVEPLEQEPASPPDSIEQAQEPAPQEEPQQESNINTETPEPVPALEPQVIASTFPISQAREFLIKAREMIQFRKRKKLEKIMGLFLQKQTIANDDVQKLLYVSDATATRYLDHLERKGRIKKENAGKYLVYSRM